MESTMGKRIMALRKAAGLTQDQLAERMGVSAQAVSKWENDVSCPDISLLAGLANVFGISTDELLGVAPLREPSFKKSEQVREDDKDNGKGKRGHYEMNFDFGGGKRGALVFAGLLVLIGVALLLSKTNLVDFGASFGFWDLVWPAAIFGVGVCMCMGRVSFFPVGVTLLGLYFLLRNLGVITFTLGWEIIVPVLLVLAGLSIAIDAVFKPKHYSHSGHYTNKKEKAEYSCANGSVSYECAFTTDSRAVTVNEPFKGGRVEIAFGKSTLDLTGIKSVAPGAVLDVETSFGSFELVLPRHIRIDTSVSRAFGSIEMHGSPDENATELLMLRGESSFSGVSVYYR